MMNDMSEKQAAGNMASHDEQTPLLQVVAVRPHRDRYPHHTVSLFAGHIMVLLGADTGKDGSLKQYSFAAFAP